MKNLQDIMTKKGIATLSKDGDAVKLANSFGTIGNQQFLHQDRLRKGS